MPSVLDQLLSKNCLRGTVDTFGNRFADLEYGSNKTNQKQRPRSKQTLNTLNGDSCKIETKPSRLTVLISSVDGLFVGCSSVSLHCRHHI